MIWCSVSIAGSNIARIENAVQCNSLLLGSLLKIVEFLEKMLNLSKVVNFVKKMLNLTKIVRD